ALQSRRLPATGGQGLTVTADGAQTTVLFRDPASPQVRGGGFASDAEVLAFTMEGDGHRALLIGGTRITLTHGQAGQTVVAASAPVSLAARGRGPLTVLNCVSGAAVTLALYYQGQPAVLLDGKTHPARYDATTNLLSIEVPAGDHELAIGDGAANLVSHALPPLAVTIDGQPQPLEGYARRTADGLEPVHWGLVELPRADRYRLEVGGQPRRVVVDQTTLAAGAEQWLEAGRHWLMITGPVAALQLTGLGSAAKPAAQLPAGFKPAADSLVIDADPVTAESEVKGKVIDKVGALGGKAHCNWDTPGQWAEWEFAVPRAGRYQLLIRACGDDGEVVRALLLDGQPLALLRLAPTGGWSRESDDWRYSEVPEAVNLTAGRHRLRLEQVGGSLNLDSLVWQPRP
ncbi:MAG: hypothetical protein HUU35_15545, partial [Armatimonadetes bacterium]|nr:hypothetical protein [Armatimonadota bacterium]